MMEGGDLVIQDENENFLPFINIQPDYIECSPENENLFLNRKASIEHYVNHTELSSEQKIQWLVAYKKAIDLSILDLSSSLKILSNELKAIFRSKKEQISPQIPKENYYTVQELNGLIAQYLMKTDDEYRDLKTTVFETENNLSLEIDAKYFLEDILSRLKVHSSILKPAKRNKSSKFNQFQTVILFNLLRELNFFDKNATNSALSESICNLTGFSNVQTVKFFSELNDTEKYNRNKMEIKELLGMMIQKLG